MKVATIIFAVLLAGITYLHPFVSLATMGLIVSLTRPVIDGWIRRRDYLPCLVVAFVACLFTNSIVWGVQQKPHDAAAPAPAPTPISSDALNQVMNYKLAEDSQKERPADNPHASGPDASADADRRQAELMNQVHGAANGNAVPAIMGTPVPTAPLDETVCVDGTKTTATGRGACSHHGGVLYGR